MNYRIGKCAAMAFGILLVLGIAVGQSYGQTTGSVSGTVSDQSGSVISQASLTLRNVNTGETRTVRSSNEGLYVFSLILPGTYDLSAEKSGFSMVKIQGLVVQVDTPLHLDLTLKVGDVTEEVKVGANPVAVNTVDASLGDVIGPRTMTDLPLNGRSFLQLATLSAGVNPPATQNNQSVVQVLSGSRSSMTVSISGSREISSLFLFDGIPSKNSYIGGVGIEPPIDSIAEFKLQRGYFSPEFQAPAVVNVVIKSGSNDLHGAAWEFLRNDKLDARNYFDTAKPPYRQNQFGANVGGRILRDKLFYFGDFEMLRVRQSNTARIKVPTSAQLNGDFSGLPTIYDPATYDPQTGTRQPFPNNQIPEDRISAFASLFSQFIPAPNSPPLAQFGGANYVKQVQHIDDDNKYDIKIDYVRSSKDRFFGRFSYLNSDVVDMSPAPFDDKNLPWHSRNLSLSWTHIFSDNTINEFRVGLDRANQSFGSPRNASGYPDWPTTLGLSNLNTIRDCNAVPNVAIIGYASLGFTYSGCGIFINTDKVFLDNFSYTNGRHHLSTGGQLIRVNHRDIATNAGQGIIQFYGFFSGDAAADYVLGAPFLAYGAAPSAPVYLNGWWRSLYVNDDYRVTRNLSINMGLGWQYTQPLIEKYNRQGQFDPATGTLWAAGDPGHGRNITSPHHFDMSPRFGVAYSPSPNWAIRASAGIFYDRLPGNEEVFGTIQPKFSCTNVLVSDFFVPTVSLTNIFPNCTPASVGQYFFQLADRKNAYLQQWTLSVQHTLPGSILVELAYVGSKGTHLSKRVDANFASLPDGPNDPRTVAERRPYPQWGFIIADKAIGSSSYHGMQLSARKEFSHGLTFLTGYTWAKSLDNDSYDYAGSRNQSPFDMDKGRSTFDLRNRFTASISYELPVGKNLRGAARTILSGWTVDGIITLQSGLPFTPTVAVDLSGTGAFHVQRPNRVCNGNLPVSKRTPDEWFDTSCFVEPAPFTFGNSGVFFLDTDGTKNADVALLKDFGLAERKKLQFRAEFFNAFNNVNFGAPVAAIGLPGQTGKVFSASPGRIIQFGLKFLW